MISRPHNAPEGYDRVLRVLRQHHDLNLLACEAGTESGSTVRMQFRMPVPHIWEWTILPPGTTMPPGTGMLLPFTAEPQTVRVESEAGRTLLHAPGSTVRIDTAPWFLRLEDDAGRDIFRENPSDVDGLGRPFVLPLGFVRSGESVAAVTFSFHLEPDEHLYGLGEKFLPLNRLGQHITSWTQDAFGSTSERSHKNIPLLISTRGYGLFLDTGARITWDLGVTSCQSCTVTVEAPSLRVFLIPGNDPAEILKRYATLDRFCSGATGLDLRTVGLVRWYVP